MTTLIFTSDFGTCERLLRATYLSETENIFFCEVARKLGTYE